MSTASIIKSMVSMEDILNGYGFELDRAGFMPCPFHSEKTSSFSVKGEKWKCFGCNRGGDVIDFVMELCGINFQQAIARINEDFRLELNENKPNRSEMDKIKRRRAEREFVTQRIDELYNRITTKRRRLWEDKRNYAPVKGDTDFHWRYVRAVGELPRLDYFLDTILKGGESD